MPKRFTCASIALLLATALFPAAVCAQAPPYLMQWGTFGTGPGQFNLPSGVAIDQGGSVYIADTENDRIQKFGEFGAYVLSWGSRGPSDGQFEGPVAIAAGPDGSIYVAENGSNSSVNQHRVQKFTSDGTFLTKWGTLGHADGEFNSPYGLAVDDVGFVYVADTGNDRIQKFTSDGQFVTAWGVHGPADGQFIDPWGVASGTSGDIYVTQQGFSRIQHFSSDGGFLGSWGEGSLGTLRGVAVDLGGTVYALSQGPTRVWEFTSTGTLLSQWGTTGTGNAEFDRPIGVSVSAHGRVYVVDTYNHRVQVFGDAPTGASRRTWGALKAKSRGAAEQK